MPSSKPADQRPRVGRPTAMPYSWWALDQAIAIDRACPGLLARTFQFGSQRRQALFLTLALVAAHGVPEIARRVKGAANDHDGSDVDPAATLGRSILHLRPRDLVQAVVGSSPAGLMGTLARLGDTPCDTPEIYCEVVKLFCSADPIDRRRVKVLAQIPGGLVGAQIRIVGMLAPVLLHPALVAKLYEVKQVEEIHYALAYARTYCTWASDAAIRVSLGRLRPQDHRGDLIKYWASRFDRVPHDLDTRGDQTLTVLSSAAMMRMAGLKYKNCLKSKICDAFLGSQLYVEYIPVDVDEPGAIAELRRTNIGFLLEGLYAADNRRVRADRAAVIRRKLVNCGVALLDHAPGDPIMVRTTGRILGQWALGDPDNDAWGEEPLDAVDDLQQALGEVA